MAHGRDRSRERNPPRQRVMRRPEGLRTDQERPGGHRKGLRPVLLLEPAGGFEPPTFRLQVGCAANCATPAMRRPS
jgi:hypothetical protein